MNEEGVELPSGWVRASFGSLGNWGSGGTPSRKVSAGYGGSIPWLKIGDLPDARVTTSEESITEYGLQHSSAKLLKPETLLIAMYGASIGKLGITTVPCTTNQAIASCEPHPGIYPRYLFYFALSQRRNLIGLGQGGAQPNISQTILKEYEVVIAPTKEQRRIVSKIDELFSSIEAGERALGRVRKLVDHYRQSVLKAAVTGELTRAWREKHEGELESGEAMLTRILEANQTSPRRNLNNAYEVDWLPDLPVEWAKVRMDVIGDVQLGRQRSPAHHNGSFMRPYLRVANVYEEFIDTESVMSMNFTPEEFKTFELKYGDVLLNEGQSKELVGRPAIYKNEVPGACFTNTLVRFRVTDCVLPEYALLVFIHYLKSGIFQKIARITTNIAHLGAGRFAEMSFPLPSIPEQREILDRVSLHSSLYNQAISEIEGRRQQVRSLRQAVLRSAFAGNLVSQDPSDEPASVLLDRIDAERSSASKRPAVKQVRKKRAKA